LALHDNNLFDQHNLRRAVKFFEELSAQGYNFEKAVFGEAFCLSEPAGDEIRDAVLRHNMRTFFFGRDAINEESNRNIGRRFRGKLKTQPMLDQEKQNIIEFAKFLQEQGGGKTYGIRLSYIFHPWMSHQEIGDMYLEMVEFAKLFAGLKNVNLATISHSPLNPYPGSELRRKFKGQFVPIEMVLNADDLNYWGYGDGFIGSHTLDYYTGLYNFLRVRWEKYGDKVPTTHLILLANDLVHGKYVPGESTKRINSMLCCKEDEFLGAEQKLIPQEDPTSIEGKSQYIYNGLTILGEVPESEARAAADELRENLTRKVEILATLNQSR
jgi:hypothetical protein